MYASFTMFHIPFRVTYWAESLVAVVATCTLQGEYLVKFWTTATVVVEEVEVQPEYSVQLAAGRIAIYGIAAVRISFVDLARVQAADKFCRLALVICRAERTPPPNGVRACISKTSGACKSGGTRIRYFLDLISCRT